MISACPARRKKPWPLRCLLIKHGTGNQEIFHRPPELNAQWCWEKFLMHNWLNHKGHKCPQRISQPEIHHLRVSSCTLWLKAFSFLVCMSLLSCSKRPDPHTLVMIIENSPTNLDPRVGTDAQSERIDELLFDSLVHRDEHF